MSATHSSVASSGTATAVTLSSLAAQTNKMYSLLIVVFVFMILIVVASVLACSCIWLKKRKANKTFVDPERAIPLATIDTHRQATRNIASPKPPPPARHPDRPINTPRMASSSTRAPLPARPAPFKRSQKAPLRLNQRPILQSHGTDYSSGRPTRYGEDHLANSGPSASANVHNNSAFENSGSRRLDRINNS